MESNEPGGLSRRTVAKGAAWAVPAAVALGAAPKAAASPPCVPTFTLNGASCKCPGGSTPQTQSYYLLICSDPANTCTTAGGSIYIWAAESNSGKALTGPSFPIIIPAGSCDSQYRLFGSTSSAQYVHFQYSFTLDGPKAWSALIPAPNQQCGRDGNGNCTAPGASPAVAKKATDSTPSSTSSTAAPSSTTSAPATSTQAPAPTSAG